MFVVPDKENMTRLSKILSLSIFTDEQFQDSRNDNWSFGHSLWGRFLSLPCPLSSQLPNQSTQVIDQSAQENYELPNLDSKFIFRVKLLTTGNNTVRFNPNFYKTGKVGEKKKKNNSYDTLGSPKRMKKFAWQILVTGVSFNSWDLGRAILEPCTLTLFTSHLHSGISFSFCI